MATTILEPLSLSQQIADIDVRFGPYSSISEAYETLSEDGLITAGLLFGVTELDGAITKYMWTVTDGSETDYKRIDQIPIILFAGIIADAVIVPYSSASIVEASDVYYLSDTKRFGIRGTGRHADGYMINWKNRYRWADENLVPHSDIFYFNMENASLYFFDGESFNSVSSGVSNISSLINDAGYITQSALEQKVVEAVASLNPEELPDDSLTYLNGLLQQEITNRSEEDSDIRTKFNNAVGLLCTILQNIAYTSSDGIDAAEEFVDTFNSTVKLTELKATLLDTTQFKVGNRIYPTSFGVKAYYSDGTISSITSFSIKPAVLSSISNVITIAYGGMTTTCVVPATENAVSSISATTTQEEDYVGNEVDLESISLTITYEDSTTATYSGSSDLITVSPTTVTSEGTNTITVTLKENTTKTTTIEITGNAAASLHDVTMLGACGAQITATQGDTSVSTDFYYSNSNVSNNPVNGVETSLYSGNVTVSNTEKVYGETVTGYTFNGSSVNSQFSLSADGILAPVVKGNLAHFKLLGYPDDTFGTITSSSNHRYTNYIPVMRGQSLVVRFPDTVTANQTILVRAKFWTEGYGIITNNNSSSWENISLAIDANREATIVLSSLTMFTDNANFNKGYMSIVFGQEYSSTYITSLTKEQIQYVEINYSNVTANGVPPFYIKKALSKSLGQAATSGSGSSWPNYTWPRSGAYYNGYYLTFTGHLYRISVYNTSTGAITNITNALTYSSTIDTLQCRASSFMSMKYVNTDYYPILVTSWSSSANTISFIRLIGTSPTAITAQILCTWTFTGCKVASAQMSGNDMYISVTKDTSAASYPETGTYKISNIQLTDLAADADYDIVSEGLTRIGYQYPVYNYDSTLISGGESEDNILVVQKFKTLASTDFAVWEFYRMSDSENGCTLIGYLPWTKRISDLQLCSIAYAGDGVFYVTAVENYASGTRPTYIYKVITALPED